MLSGTPCGLTFKPNVDMYGCVQRFPEFHVASKYKRSCCVVLTAQQPEMMISAGRAAISTCEGLLLEATRYNVRRYVAILSFPP